MLRARPHTPPSTVLASPNMTTPTMKLTMKTLPLLAAAMITTPSANAAFTLIATDAVTASANYTLSGNWPSPATSATGGVDNGPYVRASQAGTGAITSNAYFTAGFGAGTLVQAGTYQLTGYAGDVNAGRDTWHTFDLKLMTTAGVAWSVTPTVILAYVNPNTNPDGTNLEWMPTTVQYVIPVGHALIGTEFTWGFTGTKPSNSAGFHAGFDQATVQFEAAIPEPRAALLGGLGMLMLLRRRRA